MDSLPAALKRLRDASGLTQHDVAARVGLTPQHISDLERGTRTPSLDALEALLAVYGHTVLIVPVADDASQVAWQEAPEIITALARAGLRLYRAYVRQGGSYADHFQAMNESADAIGALLRQIETKETR